MTEVFLHIYDVANSPSPKTNSAVLQLNKIFKDGIGLGGIFHSAIEIYDKTEWSFGYCGSGSGVFECPRTKNPMYIFRESLSLGCTTLSSSRVRQILMELSREWPGYSYDVLSKNCNHFCNEFSEKLEVERPPAWVNRFANAGETAVEAAETTMKTLNKARTEVVSASKVAYKILFGNASASAVSPDSELLENSSSNNSGRNLFRLSFMKTPSNFFSRSNSGSQTQSMDGNAHVENPENETAIKQTSNLFSRSNSGSQTQSIDGNARVENPENETATKQTSNFFSRSNSGSQTQSIDGNAHFENTEKESAIKQIL